ncbi:MAG: N-6 DNA methylase, partial [Neisseriaceae bacterium]|nr:N-6 DNA methylase [Neisseriaceae bacterium]
MSLFKDKILAQYAQDEQQIEQRFAALQAFQSKAEDIRHFKEEQYQTGFLEDIFEKCLGYTLKIHNPKQYNLEREKKDETDGKKADAVIYNTQGEVIGVIELKDQKTQDLEKVVSQAFHYHRNHEQSKYIIISNFNELRFYIDKQTAYEEFNLFTMNKDEFRRFYLILNYQSILHDLPIKLKQQTDNADNDISKKLYDDFSAFRLQLFENAKQNNPNISQKKLLRLIQKFCDRIIFILFAEDKGLLNPNTIAEIESKHTQIKGIAEISLYQIYQKYFQAIDKGSTDLGIMPYNGGLFADDSELNALIISDNILETHLPKLSAYDFKSDISVNILGHIFEQSLSDLEELNAAIDNQQFDYNQSKRKKDGIFYTPEYITQFIVEQTIGKICEEKKQALGLNEEIRLPEKIKKKLNKEEQNLLDRLYQYRNFLLELKIIDPACGSGAFLNQALEFLIKEHAFIDKYRRNLENESLGLYDIEIAILENNLYGVDINADAVEIAKLSLWLRTAQKGRKLTDLSNNIKCGNSLIDDKTVDKNAFIWQNEFPQIMANGGFDIVIGNPPYGAKIPKTQIKNIIENFSDYGISNSLNDTYFVFYAKSLKHLLRDKGYLGFITPNTWKLIENANEFRRKLFNTNFKIYQIVQYMDKVFEDATVDCDTLLIQKNELPELIQIDFVKNQFLYKTHHIAQKIIGEQDFFNLFLTEKDYLLKEKILINSILLKDELVIKNGVKPYEKGKGTPPQTAETLKIKPYTSETKIDDTFSPLIGGSYFHRYNLTWDNNYWIKYGEWLAAPREKEIFDNNEKLIFRQT